MPHTISTKPKQVERPLYQTDLYAWSLEQARLLREGRLDEVDAENVAEEIQDVGRNEYDKLESALRVLLTHMLKWDHQPERRSRSWENTIREHRYRTERQLRENPSLKSRRDEAVREGYWSARLEASSATDMDVDRFADTCPYSWEEIMGREYARAAEQDG